MREKLTSTLNGWAMLAVTILVGLSIPASFITGGMNVDHGATYIGVPLIVGGVLLIVLFLLLALGFFTLQPGEARVLVMMGAYRGTVRQDGFHWANPFALPRGSLVAVQPAEKGGTPVFQSRCKYRVSLRARNLVTEILKVNDQRGNPIEIGAVVVWQVRDTAQALFDVDDYENYVKVQSEAAVRHVANSFPYDRGDGPATEITLRDSGDAVCAALRKELQDRLAKAGVTVEEARLTHLAYAPEIAGAMLRRQQAEAVIAARQKIVHGAVSMVEMALHELSEKKVVELDEERKAAMVGNLLVVLCGETEAQPIVNAGTLYH